MPRGQQLRTTLSVGDEVEVAEGEGRYALRVLELQPEEAVSLIDTDLEVRRAVHSRPQRAPPATSICICVSL